MRRTNRSHYLYQLTRWCCLHSILRTIGIGHRLHQCHEVSLTRRLDIGPPGIPFLNDADHQRHGKGSVIILIRKRRGRDSPRRCVGLFLQSEFLWEYGERRSEKVRRKLILLAKVLAHALPAREKTIGSVGYWATSRCIKVK